MRELRAEEAAERPIGRSGSGILESNRVGGRGVPGGVGRGGESQLPVSAKETTVGLSIKGQPDCT